MKFDDNETFQVDHEHVLVVDLEATCSEGSREVPRREMETIEIGAVMVACDERKIVDEFQAFIKPMRHKQLTDFCTELTSITQEMVDAAEGFPVVFAEFLDWAKKYDSYIFSSWGAYDEGQLRQDCEFHHIDYPFPDHLNLKKTFTRLRAGEKKRKFGCKGALYELGLEFEGTHHRGIDDARNIARILIEMLKYYQ
jgi:inhibitor of KinA sporulation pathway (predicted exonuclease)